jgi:hypothetical protein
MLLVVGEAKAMLRILERDPLKKPLNKRSERVEFELMSERV